MLVGRLRCASPQHGMRLQRLDDVGSCCPALLSPTLLFFAFLQDPAYPELSAWTEGPSAEVRARAAAAAEAAAAAQAAAGDLSHAAPPGVPAESLAVDLSAAQFYAAAGAAAAALGISVDIFAAGPHWMGRCGGLGLGTRVGCHGHPDTQRPWVGLAGCCGCSASCVACRPGWHTVALEENIAV